MRGSRIYAAPAAAEQASNRGSALFGGGITSPERLDSEKQHIERRNDIVSIRGQLILHIAQFGGENRRHARYE